jgi:hypothetical protein
MMPMQQGPFTIELTPEEGALAKQIKFDPHATLGDTRAFHENGELVVQLTEMLLEREAIPEPRRRYFSDPEYHVGGRGSSRRDLFLQRVNDRDAMMRHGHFLKYLHYFIYGAALPDRIANAFKKAVQDCGMVTSGDIAPLSSAARQLASSAGLERKAAAEEFYKLSLDLGLSPSNAASIREAVLKMRR